MVSVDSIGVIMGKMIRPVPSKEEGNGWKAVHAQVFPPNSDEVPPEWQGHVGRGPGREVVVFFGPENGTPAEIIHRLERAGFDPPGLQQD